MKNTLPSVNIDRFANSVRGKNVVDRRISVAEEKRNARTGVHPVDGITALFAHGIIATRVIPSSSD